LHRYIIKNTEDFTIVLKTIDGGEYKLKPNESLGYESEQEGLMPVLEHLYKVGHIDYWHLVIPDLEDLGKVEWKKEGF
jgi:hypothetical protein